MASNAARDGFRSKHNSAYWSGRPYVGLGPAAHSFDGTTRRWNIRAWEAYRRAVAEGRSAIESEERLTDEQRETERMYLGLRTAEGLPLAAASPRRPSPPPQFAAFVKAGWLYGATLFTGRGLTSAVNCGTSNSSSRPKQNSSGF